VSSFRWTPSKDEKQDSEEVTEEQEKGNTHDLAAEKRFSGMPFVFCRDAGLTAVKEASAPRSRRGKKFSFWGECRV